MKFHITLLAACLALLAQPSLGLAMTRAPSPGEQAAQPAENPKKPPQDQAANKRIKIQHVRVPAKNKTPAR